jgi:hypothetical protein
LSGAGGLFISVVSIMPEFIVWIVALALLLVSWGRGSKKARLMALAALLIEIVSTPLLSLFYWVVPHLSSSRFGLGDSGFGLIFQLANLVHSLLVAVAWALILAALFSAFRDSEKAISPNAN